jgi:hypothetical protein
MGPLGLSACGSVARVGAAQASRMKVSLAPLSPLSGPVSAGDTTYRNLDAIHSSVKSCRGWTQLLLFRGPGAEGLSHAAIDLGAPNRFPGARRAELAELRLRSYGPFKANWKTAKAMPAPGLGPEQFSNILVLNGFAFLWAFTSCRSRP